MLNFLLGGSIVLNAVFFGLVIMYLRYLKCGLDSKNKIQNDTKKEVVKNEKLKKKVGADEVEDYEVFKDFFK